MDEKRLQEIEGTVEGMQMEYDLQGYVSTNDADELIAMCRELIAAVRKGKRNDMNMNLPISK